MKCFALVLSLVCLSAQPQTLDPLFDYRLGTQVARDAQGNTLRNAKVVAAFRKHWACPVTGAHIGTCPGWSVDHVIPLACGGKDVVWNLQWLPDQIKSEKGEFSKDRFERRVYGGRNLSKGCP